jgi:hypothetical protein
MAIVPRKRGEERALAQRPGDPFGYLRNQINRVFDDFWANHGWRRAKRLPVFGRKWT